MHTFKAFLRWYNNKKIVPTLEAMQKVVDFYHNKGIQMLTLGNTLPSLANICIHKSTTANFYPFTKSDKNLVKKNCEDKIGGPCIVLTQKVVVAESFNRDSTNWGMLMV